MNNQHDKQGSDHTKEIEIIVNTRPRLVSKDLISYQDLVELAFPGEVTDPNKVFTIDYSNPHGQDGSVPVDGEIKVKKGMVFNVTRTNRS